MQAPQPGEMRMLCWRRALAPAACSPQCLYSAQALKPSALANGGEQLCVQSGWVDCSPEDEGIFYSLPKPPCYRGVGGSIIREVMESVPVSSGFGSLKWSQRSFALTSSSKQGSLELCDACQGRFAHGSYPEHPCCAQSWDRAGMQGPAWVGKLGSSTAASINALWPMLLHGAVLYPWHEQSQWDTSEISSAQGLLLPSHRMAHSRDQAHPHG